MAPVISCDARVQQLSRDGHKVLSHIKLADIETANQTGSNPLGIYLKDGFYRIIQLQEDNTVTNALPSGSSVVPGAYQVVMDGSAQTLVLDRFWKITRQFGVKNTFTVAPLLVPDGELNPQLGATAATQNNSVVVKRSSCFLIWYITVAEAVTYRDGGDGTLKTIYFFRIYEVGTNRVWSTAGNGDVVIATAPNGRPPANQLYELVEGVQEHTASIAMIKEISVTASDATVVRKYYFGTQVTRDNLLRYLSVQLETNARDQGWATYPDRGLWSWFELAIFTTPPEQGQTVNPNQIKPGPDGCPLTWLSHRLPLSSEYITQEGPAFERDHEIWRFVNEDDYIGVLACAQYPAWSLSARSGTLRIRELVVDNSQA